MIPRHTNRLRTLTVAIHEASDYVHYALTITTTLLCYAFHIPPALWSPNMSGSVQCNHPAIRIGFSIRRIFVLMSGSYTETWKTTAAPWSAKNRNSLLGCVGPGNMYEPQ